MGAEIARPEWIYLLEFAYRTSRAITRYSQYLIVDLSVGGTIFPQSI